MSLSSPGSQTPAPDITAAILAGGRGLRMGGRDKGLVEFHGRPLVAHVCDALRPQASHLLIIANRNAERYGMYAEAVFPDELEGFQGPLAGMATALAHAPTDLVLCVPCDMPRLPADLAARMARAMRELGLDACAAHDGTDMHPVVCLLRRSLADSLRDALARGQRQVRGWLTSQRFAWVDFSDQPQAFANVNSPDALR